MYIPVALVVTVDCGLTKPMPIMGKLQVDVPLQHSCEGIDSPCQKNGIIIHVFKFWAVQS